MNGGVELGGAHYHHIEFGIWEVNVNHKFSRLGDRASLHRMMICFRGPNRAPVVQNRDRR